MPDLLDPLRSPLATQALLAAALTGLLGAATACDDSTDSPAGVVAGAAGVGAITSSRVDPDMTPEAFKALCDAEGGTMEIHPHCGGANSCKGFSYDSDTDVFTEHTCKGLNTCTGYSCVLP
ncbi:MAG: hypothetical protein EOO75_17860 [Myxococcales bacterium]|nr:MAG: hypothetical protein EOO75_17860 [Myxococcales bacterium]